jgi:multidrug efflux pump subunit AcrB
VNIAEFSIKKKITTWLVVIIMIGGGAFGFSNLGRYEDPEFTIKDAMVITKYPGATPYEVEQEVTDKLEKAIQAMSQVKEMTSVSSAGKSEITVTMKDQYDKNSLPQIWDELRRKVGDITPYLPPGVQTPIVNDDYGDVYGMYYAIYGEGFTYKELKDAADYLKKYLSLVPGVGKVIISSDQKEAIFVDISTNRLAQLGISLEQIFETLASQNLVFASGSVRAGDEYIRIQPTGQIDSVTEIGNLLIQSNVSQKQFYLNDIATITRGYVEVPNEMVYYNGMPALTIGISIASGGNVVVVGEAVAKEAQRLLTQIPVGIQGAAIYQQSKAVTESINAFTVSLVQALIIVVVVLLLFMGLRSGLIIASTLWITVFGTFFFMYLFGIDLQRISLGALVIALGMLVDNAIVVAEGILVRAEKGIDKLKAAMEVVKQTMWPLLGATIVGILAFAPIGLSQDSTGEYTQTLFYVILISLLLSWILAITVTPMLCYNFLKSKPPSTEEKDPYTNIIYRVYKSFLLGCLNKRWLTIIVMACLLATSIYGFKYVKQSFFPNSTTPMFYVGFWKHEGSDIRSTRDDMLAIENYIQSIEGVTAVTTIVGTGAMRFMLVYSPEKPSHSYGQFIVEVDDYRKIDKLSAQVKAYIRDHYPDSETKIEKVRLGPGGGNSIEVRFSGPKANVLRALSEQAKNIMHANPHAIDIKDDWRQKVKVIEPVFSETQARITGVTRADLAQTLEMAFSGKQVGTYREGDDLIPIITRPPDEERLNIATIEQLTIWSPVLQTAVPITQMVSKFNTIWENAKIQRRDQKLTITASCEPQTVITSELLKELMPKINAIPLPSGYEMQWGGEYENSNDAQTALAQNIPAGIIAMIMVVVVLFNSVKKPFIIWLCVPLAFIGVTFGLLVTRIEFGFMALLGFLSLSGMLIKNAIVLIDEIDIQIEEGKEAFQAIVDSSLSRMRPVSLAALTTILGMIPLLPDAFFVSMAVVIMFGLAFATVLTLIFVPVLYAVFFHIRRPKENVVKI